MDGPEFWALIGQCREDGGADSYEVARLLRHRLCQFDADEMPDFQALWDEARIETYVWRLWDAATLMLGPFDDEAFLDVQDWVISHGRAAVHRILENPDTLVDLAADRHNARRDLFCGMATDVHLERTGRPYALWEDVWPAKPIGERVDLADARLVAERFPRLVALQGASGLPSGEDEHKDVADNAAM